MATGARIALDEHEVKMREQREREAARTAPKDPERRGYLPASDLAADKAACMIEGRPSAVPSWPCQLRLGGYLTFPGGLTPHAIHPPEMMLNTRVPTRGESDRSRWRKVTRRVPGWR